MLGGRQCAGAKFGSLNISPATHVEACADSFEDSGSTPLASTKFESAAGAFWVSNFSDETSSGSSRSWDLPDLGFTPLELTGQ